MTHAYGPQNAAKLQALPKSKPKSITPFALGLSGDGSEYWIHTYRSGVFIVLPLPPTANTFKVPVLLPTGRIKMVLSARARDYKNSVRSALSAHNITTMMGPVSVRIAVFRSRRVGDLDNYNKVLLDALSGVVYMDDEQIVSIVSHRYDADRARVEIQINAITEMSE